jgi:hypothetical protein
VNPADRCHELAFILRKSQMKALFVGPKVKFHKSPPHSVANEYLNAVVESIHHEDLAALSSPFPIQIVPASAMRYRPYLQ